jgi:SOS-response transcriptional repressor LexA
MRNTRPLTIRQAESLDFIRAFYDRNDQLPPVDTIAEHFGFASRNAAHEMLLALERKGHIERNEVGKWRFKRACATELLIHMPWPQPTASIARTAPSAQH